MAGLILALAVAAVGCKGKDGLNGTNGVNGKNGANGANGTNGVDGTNGVNGTDGTNGANGTNGVNGTDGTNGTNGTDGTNGTNGTDGTNGLDGCPGLNAGDTPGLVAAITVSAPANGSYFTPGEQPVITVAFKDNCDRVINPANLGVANLFVYGPLAPSLTKTASKLLNCVTDRPADGDTSATDDQHHMVSLIQPRYADPSQPNLVVQADGTAVYTLAPITDETPGTYTVAIWAKSRDEKDQLMRVLPFQLGTATAEQYAAGEPQLSACFTCHKGTMSGKVYMAHTRPSAPHPSPSPEGNWAVDLIPIASCKACHNADGYALRPLVAEVHAMHRGHNQKVPGVAHPEYGVVEQPLMANYTNVVFPSLPNREGDCTKCHVNDVWKTQPSRLACGSCHENLFFDTGALTPPRIGGELPANSAYCGAKPCACTTNGQCIDIYGVNSTCSAGTGVCETLSHQAESDDTSCAACHTADESGQSPIPSSHDLMVKATGTRVSIANFALHGASGPNGTFMAGDQLSFTFQLNDGNGNPITDFKTNALYTGMFVASGPTDDPQRVIGESKPGGSSLVLEAPPDGTLSFDSSSNTYTYVPKMKLPANALAPTNYPNPSSFVRPNPPGTYSAWLFIFAPLEAAQGHTAEEAFSSASATADFRFGADGQLQPRQLVTQDSCNSCHVTLMAHGGTRQVEATRCSNCHTQGAQDQVAGAAGLPCTVDADCAGNAQGWEVCKDVKMPLDGIPETCVATRDPTPNTPIYFPTLIHNIHFARRRAGFAERNNAFTPNKLALFGHNNLVYTDYADTLVPQDMRNCTRCHGDTGSRCDANTLCGIGQTCNANGLCENNAWKGFPTTVVCNSCHDSASDYAHAMLNTYTDPSSGQQIESCDVCHGEGTSLSVEAAHQISDPYVPPYDRVEVVAMGTPALGYLPDGGLYYSPLPPPPDAGPAIPDAGPPDAGTPDARDPDAGLPDAG